MFNCAEYRGEKYKICLLDTNALSFILKERNRFKILFDRFPFPDYIYSFSPFTLYELNKNKDVFNSFIDTFSVFPCLLMKNEKEIFEEELKIKSNIGYCIQPWTLNFSAIQGNNKDEKTIKTLFSLVDIESKFKSLEQTINETYEVLVEWQKWAFQYPSNSAKLKYRIVEAFALSQIKFFNPDFFDTIGKEIKFQDYPSIRLLGDCWFYKFVSDKKRNVGINDVVDILNLSTLPYCDLFIGEANLCDVIFKIKTTHFLNNVEIQKASILLEK